MAVDQLKWNVDKTDIISIGITQKLRNVNITQLNISQGPQYQRNSKLYLRVKLRRKLHSLHSSAYLHQSMITFTPSIFL